MSDKKKIVKLTDRQYYEYIMTLKGDAALYGADGEPFVPKEIDKDKEKKKD